MFPVSAVEPPPPREGGPGCLEGVFEAGGQVVGLLDLTRVFARSLSEWGIALEARTATERHERVTGDDSPPSEVGVIKILVVDDAIFMRSMIRDIFARGPFVIAGEAENGVEAVRLYQELRPDLTTMDIVMPQMDGITALREIIRFDPAAKVVMCSALGQEALIAESIEAGACDFIVKPFQPSRVLKVVQSVLGLDDQLRPPASPGRPGEGR